ncbi:2-phosphosulfolactate phosphatase [Chthoniobacter flavus Ellin428]|uniref:Probable 2-phosphosulfolactate phosphatase n=1 Tax=Chthoniobacter flavus Ellin428 TaxID=497964 RepID=B4DC81_9BACT|nr:2-phosphosulfolactate phosphatase [Chthoniobacter flavus]EDY15958.1 2-phosphosulfolactate phosphatase [Chthoniobacter flavus Ellin428]TCO82601.1 2-phosphosulfolactate phosphatase [Chthoniobacter flavus]
MYIDVALNPAEITLLSARDLTETTCVVFDILRATSSMVTALAHGVPEIYPVCTIEEARAMKAKLPEVVLGGERKGDRIAGFDIGNSPSEYQNLQGRRIVTTTTNGTVALRACERAQRVLVGALLNLDALAKVIRTSVPENLLLVCAGTFETFALEDAYAAGRLIAEFTGATHSDAAQTVAAMAAHYPTPLEALRAARNGQALTATGRAGDVEWCAQVSRFNVVGLMEAAVIRPLPA